MPPVPWMRQVIGAYCPACGSHELYLLHGQGNIYCRASGCPDPDAAMKILSTRETRDIVEFTGEDFRILHPLRERISGQLFGCPVHRACTRIDGPPEGAPGRYHAWLDEDGKLVLRRAEEP